MTDAPILFQWSGDAMVPAGGFQARQADKQYVVGETYRMVEHHDRSTNSHNHYFATINDLWQTLPDHLLEEYPSAEHLRKKALIRAGFHTSQDHVCGSKAEALRLRAFVAPLDEYAIVVAKESVVRVYRPMTQKRSAMNAKDFQRSKQAVLDFIASLLGIEADQIGKAA